MKTLIIGNLGSGKTTLAEKIGKMYEIPFFSIDNIVHDDTKGVKRTNQEQIDIMAEAIVDHRASLEYEARSIYEKIVSSADRETSVENMLERSFLYQADKHRAENPSVRQIIEYSYKKLSSKYGKGGYAKMYYPDKKYTDYLETMQSLLEDEEKFVQAEMKIAKKIERKNKKEIEEDER